MRCVFLRISDGWRRSAKPWWVGAWKWKVVRAVWYFLVTCSSTVVWWWWVALTPEGPVRVPQPPHLFLPASHSSSLLSPHLPKTTSASLPPLQNQPSHPTHTLIFSFYITTSSYHSLKPILTTRQHIRPHLSFTSSPPFAPEDIKEGFGFPSPPPLHATTPPTSRLAFIS